MTRIEQIEEVLKKIDELVLLTEEVRTPKVRDSLSEEQIAAMMVLVDVMVKRCRGAKDNLDAALKVHLGKDVVLELPELEVSVERTESAPKKSWKHDALLSVVIEAILERERDPDTGTIDTPYHALMSEILDYAAVSYWRTKKLQELGINANEFCELGDKKTSFRISQQNGRNENDNTDDFFD